MAIQQPNATDPTNSPDHSLSHRVFANDNASSVKAVVVDASNNILLGDGGTTNYATFSNAGRLSFAGTAGISLPYLMQSDSTTQSIANIANAQVVTFDTNVYASGITRTSSSRFTVPTAGTYLITVSAIADTTTAGSHIELWLRVNGNDVDGSNTRVQLAANTEMTLAVSFIQQFTANQYFELWTWGDSTNAKWLATAAGTSPTRPAVPSIIMTCNMISKD